jgi:hypothetical protein
MSFIENIMPSRNQAQDANTIIDLDEVLSQTSAVKVNGKTYLLIPITIGNSIAIDKAKTRLKAFINGITNDDPSDMTQVYKEYYNFIKLVVPDLTLDDVNSMTVVQLNRFFKISNEHINLELTGKTLSENENEKKKILAASNLE